MYKDEVITISCIKTLVAARGSHLWVSISLLRSTMSTPSFEDIFNYGVSLFQEGKYEEALKEFCKVCLILF